MAALNDPVSASPYIFGGNTRAAYAAMLKIWYAKRWDDHVHEATFIMQKLAKRGDRMGGSSVISAVVTGFPQSGGITSRENRGLPSSRNSTHINPQLVSRDFYIRLAWSGQVERSAAAGDKASFAKPRLLDIQLARKQADINMCRKVYLGYADILGGVSAYDGGTDIATLHGRNARTSAGEAYWYAGRHYMRVNQSVGFANTPLGAPTYDIEGGATGVVNEHYISAIGGTTAAPTITILPAAPSVDPAAGDLVLPFHNRAVSGYSSAADDITLFSSFNGIGNICTDESIYAALYGLSKTTSGNESLKGFFMHNSGTVRAYREREFALMIDRIRDEGTGDEADIGVMHASTRREVVAEHDGDRRYAPVQTESGFAQLVAFVGEKGIPLMSDWMCQPAMVVALNTRRWSWIEQSPMGPLGAERWVANFDQNEMIWHKSGNIECQDPFNNGIYDDIDIDVFALNS